MKFLLMLGLISSLSFADLLNVKNLDELHKVEKFFNSSNGELKRAMLEQNPNFLSDVQETRIHLENLENEKNTPKEEPQQVAQKLFVYDLALEGQFIKMVLIYNNRQSISYLNKFAIVGTPICNNVLCSFQDNNGQQYFFNRTSQVLPKLQQILYGKTNF